MMLAKGYYDEEGYWHREVDDGPLPRAPPQPIRDPYYDHYQGQEEMYDPYGRRITVRRVTTMPRRRRVTTSEMGMFSGAEIKDLVIATLVLAVAFTLVMSGSRRFVDPMGAFIDFFPISLIATGTAFTAHEISHKFMAQKHGLPAEFVINKMGIVIALASALLIGFLFALPGAVVFSGLGADKKVVGKVGAAGPAMNIVLAMAFFPAMLFLWADLWTVVFVNVFLGGFNMIPFDPFDGKKVWRWNPGIYLGMLAVIIALGVLSLLSGGLLSL
jgi:Zn-dependent protease